MLPLEAELEQIEAAITAVLQGGQSYTINSGGSSRLVTYADIDKLLKRKKELETAIAAESGGGLGMRLQAGW